MRLIDQCTRSGNFLSVDRGSVRVEHIDRLPLALLQALKENKQHILEALERDKLAKKLGSVIGMPGEVYTWTLSNRSALFVERDADKWIGYRAYYHPNQPPRFNLIASGRTFEHVIKESGRYVEFMLNRRTDKVQKG